MIIDSHVHIGNIMNFNMPEEMVLKSMEKYNIDYSLVSNIEASEVDGNQELIPIEFQHSQTETCEKILRFAKNNPKKIGALLWVKPRLEGCTEEFKNLVKENRGIDVEFDKDMNDPGESPGSVFLLRIPF